MKLNTRWSLITILFFSIGCGTQTPHTPDTDAPPSLTLKFDRSLDSSTVSGLSAVGVRGKDGQEDTTYTTIYFRNNAGDSYYSLSSGVVVEKEMLSSNIANIYVRYGKTFVIIYRSVINPQVTVGQILEKGEWLGKLALGTLSSAYRDAWIVEIQAKIEDKVFVLPVYDFVDGSSKKTMDNLWADISVKDIDTVRPWAIQEKMDISSKARFTFWY